MLFLGGLSVLVAFLCSTAFTQKVALTAYPTHGVAERGFFSSVQTVCSGSTCPKTSTSIKSSSSSKESSSSASQTPSSASSSRTSTLASKTSSISTGPYNPYILTTTFTQPPACTGGFSAIADWGTEIYENVIYSEVNSAYTSCFPPQFYSSVLATTSMGPFSALICPYTWESYDFNSTYIICCPSGFNLIAPNATNTQRPGAGAVCTSSIWPDQLMDITSFDSTGGATDAPTTAGADGTIVYANAFDGIAATAFNVTFTTTSTTASSTSGSSSALRSTSISTSSSSSNTSSVQSSISSSSSPTSTAFVSLGCYTEGTNSHALGASSSTSYTTMTVEICASFCSAYTYMGVEYGGECYCANALATGAASVPNAECQIACGGNAAEKCGGASRLNLYSKGGVAPVYPGTLPSVGKYLYTGCYTEGTGVRALGSASFVSNTMTVEACEAFCAPTYTMFGLEYMSECYCGNSLGAGSVVAPAADCSLTCAGNAAEFCGAGNRLDVYTYTA